MACLSVQFNPAIGPVIKAVFGDSETLRTAQADTKISMALTRALTSLVFLLILSRA